MTTELLAFKKKALSGVKDVKSSDPARLKAGTIRILEIGVGTGELEWEQVSWSGDRWAGEEIPAHLVPYRPMQGVSEVQLKISPTNRETQNKTIFRNDSINSQFLRFRLIAFWR